MAIIRPNVYRSSVVADPLAEKTRQKWADMAKESGKHVTAVSQAWLRQKAIDAAREEQDKKAAAEKLKRDTAIAEQVLSPQNPLAKAVDTSGSKVLSTPPDPSITSGIAQAEGMFPLGAPPNMSTGRSTYTPNQPRTAEGVAAEFEELYNKRGIFPDQWAALSNEDKNEVNARLLSLQEEYKALTTPADAPQAEGPTPFRQEAINTLAGGFGGGFGEHQQPGSRGRRLSPQRPDEPMLRDAALNAISGDRADHLGYLVKGREDEAAVRDHLIRMIGAGQGDEMWMAPDPENDRLVEELLRRMSKGRFD
jgi:hypothetical protein